jgi:hypothetical protein
VVAAVQPETRQSQPQIFRDGLSVGYTEISQTPETSHKRSEVTLQLTVSQYVSMSHLGTCDQILILS